MRPCGGRAWWGGGAGDPTKVNSMWQSTSHVAGLLVSPSRYLFSLTLIKNTKGKINLLNYF